MPVLPSPLPARRPLLAGVALLVALMALVAAWRAAPRGEFAPAAALRARPAEPAPPASRSADPARPPAPPAADSAAPAERPKHPYAPGGDDLLHWEAPAPAAGVARVSPGAGGGTLAGFAEAPAAPLAVVVPGAAAQALPLPDLSAFPIVAVADFFGDGRPGLFTVARQRASFMAADRQGRWADRSPALLREDDRAACAQPRQALAEDLNGDERPDVYLVCGAEPPAACCRHQVFLSQPDGHYRLQDVAASWEGATDLRDVDGDGRLDAVGEGVPPRVLYGSGDGRFAAGTPRQGRK